MKTDTDIKNPAENEASAKKIWFIESAVAIAASVFAIIIASIY